jgi:hypothetical protein
LLKWRHDFLSERHSVASEAFDTWNPSRGDKPRMHGTNCQPA